MAERKSRIPLCVYLKAWLPVSVERCCLTGISFTTEIRSWDPLIFIIGIHIPWNDSLYTDMESWSLLVKQQFHHFKYNGVHVPCIQFSSKYIQSLPPYHHFQTKYSQKTLHISPMRMKYGVSFVSSKSRQVHLLQAVRQWDINSWPM